MEEVYAQVCILFGENPKVVEPSDFFKTFIDFITNYKVDNFVYRINQLIQIDLTVDTIYDNQNILNVEFVYPGNSVFYFAIIWSCQKRTFARADSSQIPLSGMVFI